MKIKNIVNIIKDILVKSCIYFTGVTIVFTSAALMLAQDIFSPNTCFMFALAALGAGIATQVFRITVLPSASRHIAFFILLYIDFFLVFLPLRQYTASSNTALYMSVMFIAVYLIIFGIVMGVKSALNAVVNKNLKYEKQFKNINSETEKDGEDK